MATVIRNQVVGTPGNDTLDGALQAAPATNFYTELFGGAGNDVYYIDAASSATVDRVVELPGGGTDTVFLIDYWNGQSGYWVGASTYTLLDNIENLNVMGTPSVTGGSAYSNGFTTSMLIVGNGLNNAITTGGGNDTLWGGQGIDTLSGGLGSDDYYIDDAKDAVIENPTLTGTDNVISTVTHTLTAGVENLYLDYKSGNINGTGNLLNNSIYGSTGDNALDGGAGNDSMHGGGGKDKLKGGDGDDTLVGDGNAYTNVYFDNLTFAPVAATNYGGDSLDGGKGNDTLYGADGDTLLGGDGNDQLYGNATANGFSGTATIDEKITLDGGKGDDTFSNFGTKDTLKDSGGLDTALIDFGTAPVKYTLVEGIERGILTNTGATDDVLIGNKTNNYLQGNSGNDRLDGLVGDDVLDGGLGKDTMIGGDGNDSFMVDDVGDVVVEAGAAGKAGKTSKGGSTFGGDTVFSYIKNYALGANVENLVLEDGVYNTTPGTGGLATNGKGNALNNVIIGNSKANLLEGMAGNDTLDGGIGKDTLIGGSGNDTYYVSNTADIIQELADTVTGGIDNVLLVNEINDPSTRYFNGTAYAMASHVENLDASAITAAGSTVPGGFTITGNESANKIIGSRLNDTIIGGAGNDTMDGGIGNDTYYVNDAGDTVGETVTGTTGGTDAIMFNASLGVGSFTMGANIENLTMLGGSGKIIGSAVDNVITGNGADNVIDGAAGHDLIYGHFGKDQLTGGAGNDTLDGGAGQDTLDGGADNDTYIVDKALDQIIDSGGSTDLVRTILTSYNLSDSIAGGGNSIENLAYGYWNGTAWVGGNSSFTGTGNTLANSITGGVANDLLDGKEGNDTLDGSAGADTMRGGAGDDTFYIDSIGDLVKEDSSSGGGAKDTVISTIDYSLLDTDGADTLGGGVENLTLASTLSGGANAYDATGNDFNNVITGNENTNFIDGGTGIDSMIGGDGSDVYFIDDAGDKITELSNVPTTVKGALYSPSAGEADEINATLADGKLFDMSANAQFVERMYIFNSGGTGTVNVKGNTSDNAIWGGHGANSIDGGDGSDVINGGAGNDTLIGGKGDDVLNGDGLYADSYSAPWITASGGLDSMSGGDGNDTFYVDAGDGAGTGTSEDTVSGGAGIDTVKLLGSLITTGYTMDADIENLDISGLSTSGAVRIDGNTQNNLITGRSGFGANNNKLLGGDGSDTFYLAAGNGDFDTVHGGFNDRADGDTSKADVLYAKPDASSVAVGAVTANLHVHGIEAVVLDVSNNSQGFTWITDMGTATFSETGAPGNFTQASSTVSGGIAPTVTITGGITGGQTTSADTTGTSVAGDITLTGLSATPTYVLSNYFQTSPTTTTLTLASTVASTDSLKVTLDNHAAGGLASAGIETLYINSTGDVLDNAAGANVLDVSGVTPTSGMTLVDATGDSSLQVFGLAAATAAGAQQTVFLHDFSAAKFTAKLSSTAGSNFLTVKLDNVETSFATDGTALENLNLDVTGSTHANTLNANGSRTVANAGINYVSGDGSLTLNQWRGNIDTTAVASFSTGFTGKLDVIGSAAVAMTVDGGDITFSSFSNSTLAVPNAADTFIFNLDGTATSSLNATDTIDGGLGTDNLTATVDGLDSLGSGQLHIANVENLIFNLSSGKDSSIDTQFITGVNTVTIGGTAAAGDVLTLQNLVAGTLTATGFGGALAVYFTDGVVHNVTDGNGNDTIVSGNMADTITLSAGNDQVSAGAGDDLIIAAASLNSSDIIDGGDGTDDLTFTDSDGTTTDLNQVVGVESITLGNAATSVTTLDALVSAGATLDVSATALGGANTLTWNGAAELDGSFSITGSAQADTITGGAGNDSITGGNGADSIAGGLGDDVITMGLAAAGIDAINAGSGIDTLTLTGTPAGTVIIDLSSTVDQIVTINAVADALIQNGFEHLNAASMGAGPLHVTAAATGSSIIGRTAGTSADTFVGGVGNDSLSGGNGIDTITGAAGDDVITMVVTSGNTDVIDAGADYDTLVLTGAATGTVTVNLTGVDQFTDGTDASTQSGFEDLDASAMTGFGVTATALATGSMMIGSAQADSLTGGAGVDILDGGSGNDTITGSGGGDYLTGSIGSDIFVFNTLPSSGEMNTVTDFISGTDFINLAHATFEMLTTTAGGTLSTAEFASGDGLMSSTVAGTVIVYNSSTGDLYYDADANGGGTGVLIAHLNGVPAITVSDIAVV